MRAFPRVRYQQVLNGLQIDTLLPAFLISQKSKIFDSFPMNAAGKILKYKMRQDYAKELGLTGDGADTAGPGK